MSTDNGQIIFRQIINPRPGDWTPAMHWYVEFHSDTHDMAYPLGIAFVSAHSQMKACVGHSASLDFIYVCDQERRQGVATKLIAAVRARWPDIYLGEAISEAGEGLLAALPAAQEARR